MVALERKMEERPHIQMIIDRPLTDAEFFAELHEVKPEIVPKGVGDTEKKRSGTLEAKAVISQMDIELPHCHYCQKPFLPNRSNQKFCTPELERKKNWVRRMALVDALVELFQKRGCCALRGDLAVVAKKCVDFAYDAILKAIQRLGYKYNERLKQWQRPAKPVSQSLVVSNGNGANHE